MEGQWTDIYRVKHSIIHSFIYIQNARVDEFYSRESTSFEKKSQVKELAYLRYSLYFFCDKKIWFLQETTLLFEIATSKKCKAWFGYYGRIIIFSCFIILSYEIRLMKSFQKSFNNRLYQLEFWNIIFINW